MSSTGNYAVTVMDTNGTFIDSTWVYEILKPVANFTDSVDYFTVVFTNFSQNADSFLWDFGDGTTSSDVSPIHLYAWTPAQIDCYDVTLYAYNFCGVDSIVKNTCSVGVNELSNTFDIMIYPNPNNGSFNVKLEFAVPSTYLIYLYNSVGKSVYTKFTKSTKKSVTETMSVQNLAKGVYLLHVVYGGQVVTKKIIVE